MNPLDAFEGILLSLHRAVLDDAHWPATAALIDEAVGTACSGLGVSEGFENDAHVHFVGSYHRGERRRDLEREYLDISQTARRTARRVRLRRRPLSSLSWMRRLRRGVCNEHGVGGKSIAEGGPREGEERQPVPAPGPTI